MLRKFGPAKTAAVDPNRDSVAAVGLSSPENLAGSRHQAGEHGRGGRVNGGGGGGEEMGVRVDSILKRVPERRNARRIAALQEDLDQLRLETVGFHSEEG